jgi:hypothetical protein
MNQGVLLRKQASFPAAKFLIAINETQIVVRKAAETPATLSR